jgi:VWFA-related protein
MLAILALTGAAAHSADHPADSSADSSADVDSTVADGVANMPWPETTELDTAVFEVFVTDASGQPITDLVLDDFELTVNGTSQQIVEFSAPTAVRGIACDIESTAADVSGNTPPGAGGRSPLVVFLDERGGQSHVRNEFLRELGDAAALDPEFARRMMLVALSDRIRVLHTFSDDPARFGSIIEGLQDIPSPGSPFAADQAALLGDMNRLDPNVTFNFIGEAEADRRSINTQARSLLVGIKAHAADLRDDQRHRVTALSRFVESLAGLEGHKALIYVGEGFYTEPGSVLLNMWGRRYPGAADSEGFNADYESGQLRIRDEFLGLLARANAAGVSIYGVQTPTLLRSFSGSAERGSLNDSFDNAMKNDSTPADSLTVLAGETGGLTLSSHGGELPNLARFLRALDSYYSIGFRPIGPADQRRATLDVRIRQDNLRLRHRQTYLLKTIDQRMSEVTYATLLFDPGANPIEAELELEEIAPGKGDSNEVTVMLTLPLEKLALIPDKDSHAGGITVYFAVKDGRGDFSTVHSQSVPVRIPNESLPTTLGQRATVGLTLISRDGPHELAVILRDDLSALVSTVTLEFEAPGRGP